MTNWPFYSNCIMPWDRMFDWWHNSSSRSVAARTFNFFTLHCYRVRIGLRIP